MSAPGWSDPRRQTWDDAAEAQKENRRDRGGVEKLLRAAAHAEVQYSKLARSSEWHDFQQLCQAAIEEASGLRALIGPKLMDPDITSHEELLKLKMKGIELTTRIETLELVLNLPLEIQEHGAQARKALEEAEWLKPTPAT